MGLEKYSDDKYLILLICEGSAEVDIINWLLDEDRLFFSRENLVFKKVHTRKSVDKIKREFLGLDFGDKEVVIFRVIDSRKEKFNLGKLYNNEVYTFLTRDEIENLMIIDREDYGKWSNTREKSSVYAAREYNIKKIKSEGTMFKFFNGDIDRLLDAIKKHKKYKGSDGYTICDLLK